MRFVNIRDDKLLIEKETGLKIDFKRSKNTLRGAWGLVSGEIDIKKRLLAQEFNDKKEKHFKNYFSNIWE